MCGRGPDWEGGNELIFQIRFILDDGSGEGHLYANNDMVREVMGVTYKEWAELKEIVIKIGHLTYTKNSLEQQQVSLEIINFVP